MASQRRTRFSYCIGILYLLSSKLHTSPHIHYHYNIPYLTYTPHVMLHTLHIIHCNLYQNLIIFYSQKTYSLAHKNLLTCSQKPTLLLTKTCCLTQVHPITTVSLSRNLYFRTSRFRGAGPFLTRPDAS